MTRVIAVGVGMMKVDPNESSGGKPPFRTLRPSSLSMTYKAGVAFQSAIGNRQSRSRHHASLQIRRWTELFDYTVRAQRVPCLTDLASMGYQQVREDYPVFLRNKFHQVLLDLFWLLLFCQPEPPAKSCHVRIDNYAGCNSECITHDHVRGLTGNTWKLEQLFNRMRHLTLVLVH